MGQIFLSCPNLTGFSVIDGSFSNVQFDYGNLELMNAKFSHPEEKNIKNEKLETFEFRSAQIPITYVDLPRIFKFFPNLKNLTVGFSTYGQLKGKELLHFQTLFQLIANETCGVNVLRIYFDDVNSQNTFERLSVVKLKCALDYDLSR